MHSYLVAIPSLVRGLGTTFELAIAAMACAVALGFVLGTLRSMAPRALDLPLLGIVEFFRGIPLLVLMYFLFFGLPQLGLRTSNNAAAIAALAVYAGALASEIVRGAIVSIPLGQTEAAAALGLGRFAILRLIDVTDLLQAARQNVERDPDVALPIYLTVLVAYFVVNYPISLASQRLEKRLT